MVKNIPTVLVVFGATGDLFAKKIVPALFHLYQKDKLPKMFKLMGFSRRDWSDQDFRTHIFDILKKYHEGPKYEKQMHEFITHAFYHQGDFQTKQDYETLATVMGRTDDEWKVCSNKLFYLAVPPQFYSTIFTYLAETGLTLPCGPDEGWTRVIVEKPFGRDLKTAEALDLQLGKLFKEEQIYRIDHYLAKEMLQNILSFRFANNLLESSWNNKFIEKIEIRALETLGVEGRGIFYDGIGALRDFGQNHLLQMLALITMDRPKSFEVEEVRKKRGQILQTIQVPTAVDIKNHTFRAQYKGYKTIKNVAPHSITETYFRVRAELDSPRWKGVPIYLESGKRLKRQVKEIIVTFKHPEPCMCPPGKSHFQNTVTFQLEPKEKIEISFLAKKPGLAMNMERRFFDFLYRRRKKQSQYVEEYEKLLLDCIEGNQLLFISTEEMTPMWRYVDPIITAWSKNEVPLESYTPDTNDIFSLVASKETK